MQKDSHNQSDHGQHIDNDGDDSYNRTHPNSLPSGLIETAKNAQFSLYPNPTTGQVYIVLDGNAGEAQLLITDLAGKAILPEQAITGKQLLNVSGLAQGVYLVYIFTEHGNGVERLVVK